MTKVTDKKAFVNEDCIGCSACVSICWEVFELNEEGKAFWKDLESYDEDCINEAITACPVSAISWKEKFSK